MSNSSNNNDSQEDHNPRLDPSLSTSNQDDTNRGVEDEINDDNNILNSNPDTSQDYGATLDENDVEIESEESQMSQEQEAFERELMGDSLSNNHRNNDGETRTPPPAPSDEEDEDVYDDNLDEESLGASVATMQTSPQLSRRTHRTNASRAGFSRVSRASRFSGGASVHSNFTGVSGFSRINVQDEMDPSHDVAIGGFEEDININLDNVSVGNRNVNRNLTSQMEMDDNGQTPGGPRSVISGFSRNSRLSRNSRDSRGSRGGISRTSLLINTPGRSLASRGQNSRAHIRPNRNNEDRLEEEQSESDSDSDSDSRLNRQREKETQSQDRNNAEPNIKIKKTAKKRQEHRNRQNQYHSDSSSSSDEEEESPEDQLRRQARPTSPGRGSSHGSSSDSDSDSNGSDGNSSRSSPPSSPMSYPGSPTPNMAPPSPILGLSPTSIASNGSDSSRRLPQTPQGITFTAETEDRGTPGQLGQQLPIDDPFMVNEDTENIVNDRRMLNESHEQEFEEEFDEEDQYYSEMIIWGTDINLGQFRRKFLSFIRNFKLNPTNPHERPYYLKVLESLHQSQEFQVTINCKHLWDFILSRKLYGQLLCFPGDVIPVMDHTFTLEYKRLYPEEEITAPIQVRV